MTSGQLQLSIYSVLVGLITLVTLFYITTTPPDYLSYSRDGIPHLSPDVIHPQTGEPLTINKLVKHYKGELEDGTKVYY